MLPANDRGGSLKPLDNEHRLQLWDPARRVGWDPGVEAQLNLTARQAEGHAQGYAQSHAEGLLKGHIDARLDAAVSKLPPICTGT